MEKAVKTFRTIAQVPSVTSARILNYDVKNKSNSIVVYSWWNQRSLERAKSVKFQQSYLINGSTNEVTNLLPIDSSSEILSSISPSETSIATIRDNTSQENSSKKTQHLEIWKSTQLIVSVDLTALDVHGDVYADSEFGCFEWSACEKKLLYIAEKKAVKSEPFYKRKPQTSKDDDTSSEDLDVTKGEEYIFKEEWGEQLVGKHHPVVAVYDLQEDKVEILEGIPKHVSPGQVCFAPDGGFVGVAWENFPRRLGLKFCTNRPSYIFHLTVDGRFMIISEELDISVHSPRFSPDNYHLIWLERPSGGPHHACHRLVKYCWKPAKIETIVDIVKNTPNDVDPNYFRGLYGGLPRKCWSSDNVHIVLSTPGPTTITTCIINIESKKIYLVKPPDENSVNIRSSLSVLDFKEDLLLCSRSNLKCPPSLVIGKVSANNFEDIEWSPVTEWKCFNGLENAVTNEFCSKATSHITENVNEINTLFIQPPCDPGQKVPVIIWPHGGPHANFVNSFNFDAAFFALLGYGVVMVNFRGSTGLGQDYVDFILGKIGDSDVKDVYQVSEEICDMPSSKFDSKRMLLFGGSHGGFLVAHLSGQYPDAFKLVVCINPVTNTSSMITVTDIPDWCAIESGFGYSPYEETSEENLKKMYDASPIRYASKVKAPTLLLIGKKDLRVPSSQGIQYYHKLKAHRKRTKLLLYDDNHPLAQVSVEMDAIINSVLWFNEHINYT